MEQQEGLKHKHDLSRDPILLSGCLLQKQTIINVDGFIESAMGGPLLMRGYDFDMHVQWVAFLHGFCLGYRLFPISLHTAEGTTVRAFL